MLKLLLIGVGGFIGAVARYALAGLVHRIVNGGFPYGTFVVNAIGCFALGLIMYLVEHRGAFSPQTRLLLTVGVLGAFTTFSTFAWETLELLADQRLLAATVNIVLHLLIGIGAVWAALTFGRLVIK